MLAKRTSVRLRLHSPVASDTPKGEKASGTGFRLNFVIIVILEKSILPCQRKTTSLEVIKSSILRDPDVAQKRHYQHLKLWYMARK